MSADHIREAVRRLHPDARVVPDGIMFVVIAGGVPLGQKAARPERAWAKAHALMVANGDFR